MNVSTQLRAPLLAAATDDARELWSIVALLAVVGIGLAMLAVFAVKATRPDRELLAPLEVMGRRKWRRSDPVWQRRELDAVRPPDARPLVSAPAAPIPLEGFEEGPAAEGFDDLADLGSGVDHDLTELPGGVVFDADPTPPSGEIPVIAPVAAEVPLSELGIDWRPPAPEDLLQSVAPEQAPDPDPDATDRADAGAGAGDAGLVLAPEDLRALLRAGARLAELPGGGHAAAGPVAPGDETTPIASPEVPAEQVVAADETLPSSDDPVEQVVAVEETVVSSDDPVEQVVAVDETVVSSDDPVEAVDTSDDSPDEVAG